jgi:hypothetical protein
MNFKIDGWVRHSKFGDGQILEDRGDKIMIQFVNSGERLMLKEFIDSTGAPPTPGFKFAKKKSAASIAKLAATKAAGKSAAKAVAAAE